MRTALFIGCLAFSSLAAAQRAYLLTPGGVVPVPPELVRSSTMCHLPVGGVFPCAVEAPWSEAPAVFTSDGPVRIAPDITGTFLVVRPAPVRFLVPAERTAGPLPRKRHHGHARAPKDHPSLALMIADRTLRLIAEAQLVAEDR